MFGLERFFRSGRDDVNHVHLKVTPEVTRRIEELRRYYKTTSPVEIYRLALAVLDRLAELEEKGYTIAAVKEEEPNTGKYSEIRYIDLHGRSKKS